MFDSSCNLSSSQIATALLEHLKVASLEHSQDQSDYADMEKDDFPVEIVTQTQNTAFWMKETMIENFCDGKLILKIQNNIAKLCYLRAALQPFEILRIVVNIVVLVFQVV